jgi:hypothetical protein
MKKNQKPKLTCGRCKISVQKKDMYCRNCGGLFSDTLYCVKHSSQHADGVCVICDKPYCNSCGAETNNIYLCDGHSGCEIAEGMARVFGSTDYVQVQFAFTCLQQSGYHPFLYSRLFNPVADKVAITALRNFGNHPIEEQKILVPFSEVLSAVKELKKHKLKEV